MSRIILALFLLVVLVVIQIEAQKCRRYETICIKGRGCRTRCIRRGRRDVSEALQGAQKSGFEEKLARDLEENTRRFEEDVSEEEEKRNVHDEEEEPEVRFIDDVLEEEARHIDDGDDEELEEEEARSLYEDLEEE